MPVSRNYWYRIWGAHRHPFALKEAGLYSRRIDQRLRTYLVMEQHGPGKSHAPSQYDILREPTYKTRWIKTWNADSPIDTKRIFNEVRQKYKYENPYDEISK
ncbi:unnamed protein product [Rotaria sp. Silwood2]|nr:unnamed protein product [Rotaria sp. Silwood2]CAF2726082.1 unnamed protein product [Rotaria sp. Silwood2]CAF2878383.1 unnamed protein product [Rotaria sp. Silwood2]CAF3081835.1 unnamed protein product [Rotaria sp. Silwood2]CAF4420456.1 unnamed protein product [Rotaria sp. Silwood2]